jgi:uncharacterized membrane protein
MPHAMKEAAANVYAVVYRALFWGMVLSTGLFALGVAMALRHPMTISYAPPIILGWSEAWRGLARLDPAALMEAATVVLILTPVVRVILSCIAFFVDRDYKFVGVTALVLAVIVLTVILGRLGLH